MDIFFIDLEVTKHTKKISTVGYLYPPKHIKEKGSSTSDLEKQLERVKPNYVCGHNYLNHDKKFLELTRAFPLLQNCKIIDTFLVSMLLFPDKLSHKLGKPYKTDIHIENCPLKDCEETQALFTQCFERIKTELTPDIQQALRFLLSATVEYKGFFDYLNLPDASVNMVDLFKHKVCAKQEIIQSFLASNPIEMAILLVYLHTQEKSNHLALSKAIQENFPETIAILKALQQTDYYSDDLVQFARDEFGIPEFEFRSFDKRDIDFFEGKQLSQEEIIQAALQGKSILATLPTGGGKTIAFQIPALIKAKAYKGLTVVISPLQALMRDQVESFRNKNQNFKIAAVSGYLSPIERINTLEEVKNGIIDILYLAPEALRSNSIFQALTHRSIERFVIDEAHCFSSWGHDFRHDYKYIPKCIEELQNHSKHQAAIPVSCFTATAKPEVLDEIKSKFESHLNLQIEEFYASTQRTNLFYRSIKVEDEKHKYRVLLEVLSEKGKQPTIIYIPQNARACRELSESLINEPKLLELGLQIEPFYAEIDNQIESGERIGRNKSEILNDFIQNKIDIVIATTAFGMGIDKPDIKTVIHYETSDSLESYLQESGRGGRSEDIEAECIVLFCVRDFDKIFEQQTRSKVEASEIQRILKVIKKNRLNPAVMSIRQIAEYARIDTEDSKIDYEVLIKTAILELEEHDILKRGRNSTKIYATAINNAGDENKNQIEIVHEKLAPYKNNQPDIYEPMIRVMSALIGRSKVEPIEIDTLSDNVGVNRKGIHKILAELSKNKLIDMGNDISAVIKKTVRGELKKHFDMENKLLTHLTQLPDYQTTIDLRELNTDEKTDENQVRYIKKTLQSFSHLSTVAKETLNIHFCKDFAHLKNKENIKTIEKLIKSRQNRAKNIIEYLLNLNADENNEVEFSSIALKEELDPKKSLAGFQYTLAGFHHTLVYLHDMLQEFKLRKGRLIYYQGLVLEKTKQIEQPTPYQVRRDYNTGLNIYYQHKIAAIHILLKFFDTLLKKGWEECKNYITDYFSYSHEEFIERYDFDEKIIALSVTQERYQQILTDLNPEQSEIFNDTKARSILVLAGPGSGKTKTLVHKIASLITLENQKPKYFLMLTHGRAAANEFRQRLIKLVGNLGYEVEIMTFHAYALHLLGRRVSETMILAQAIELATAQILADKTNRLPKSMLVLDEYQDISAETFDFISALWQTMTTDKRIIAVGDDDQCINNFNGKGDADIKFMQKFAEQFSIEDSEETNLMTQSEQFYSHVKENSFKQYKLLTNYRSKSNLVEFTNQYALSIPHRLKNEPLNSQQTKPGFIRISNHQTRERMLSAVAQRIMDDPSQNIAALCYTNDDVLNLYSILKESNIQVKYLASQDGFSLGDLHELHFFLKEWQTVNFDAAQESLSERFSESSNYSVAQNVIDHFINVERHNSETFKEESMHFGQYLKEIKFDEFEKTKAKVIVSTMHKAKGKEFDSVYALIEKKFISDNYKRRLLYVAMTRAKDNLYIHTEDDCTQSLEPLADEVEYDQETHTEKYPIILIMNLRDISLSNEEADKGIKQTQAQAGDTVEIKKIKGTTKFCIYKNDKLIGVLSKPDSQKLRLSAKILEYENKGYVLNTNARIENVVVWYKKEKDKNFLQVLCQISMATS